MTRPSTALITSSMAATIEAVDMGHALVLMQPDEHEEVQSLSIDAEQARKLLPILQQMVGGR